MVCKKCKQEIDKKASICVHCGCKVSKPIFKKWWFWAIIVIIIIAISGGSADDAGKTDTSSNETKTEAPIVYEAQDLSVMFEDLKSNAMKAEEKYKNKNIEFSAKINNFDSDGKYIGVKAVNSDEWDFNSAMCYIKNDKQKEFLINKNIGDTITIKGKVKSIGEVLGYSIDIAEVQ